VRNTEHVTGTETVVETVRRTLSARLTGHPMVAPASLRLTDNDWNGFDINIGRREPAVRLCREDNVVLVIAFDGHGIVRAQAAFCHPSPDVVTNVALTFLHAFVDEEAR